MAQITNSDLTTVVDKLARYAGWSVGDPDLGTFDAGIALAAATLLDGVDSIGEFLLNTLDLDVEADLLDPARDLRDSPPAFPSTLFTSMGGVASFLTALNDHFKAFGFAGLDAYLTSINIPTPTLRVHGLFRRYFGVVSPRNAFIPKDIVLATFAETGATTGTFVSVATIDKTKYGGAKIVVKNAGALTTSAVVSVTGKKWDGTTQVITATLATHTDDFETDLSSTAKLFTEVTGITITTGTSGDHFEIVAKTDRSIAAA